MITLYYGDCLDILPTLPADSADMSFNDVPYGTTACRWDSVIPFEPMWEGVESVVKNNGANIFTSSQPFTSKLILSNVFKYKLGLIWEKDKASNFLLAKKMIQKYHEDINIFYTEQCTYNPIKWKGSKLSNASAKNSIKLKQNGCYTPTVLKNTEQVIWRNPKSIIKIYTCKANDTLNGCLIPTQKPVKLIEYMLKTYSNGGDTVLDITCGSGSTGIAATRTKRNALLIEKAPLWFNISVMRNQGVDLKEIKAYRDEQRKLYGKEADFKAELLFPKVVTINA